MGVLEIIGFVLKLVWGLFLEWRSAKQESKAAKKAFKTTQAKLFELSYRALSRMRSEAKIEAQQAQSVEDQVDAELKKKK